MKKIVINKSYDKFSRESSRHFYDCVSWASRTR